MIEFDRLIAILENDLFSTCEYNHSFTTVGLSLKRLFVWSQGPLYKLRFMLILLQACQDTRGGGILSVLNRFSHHGDPFIQGFIQKILPKVFFLKSIITFSSLELLAKDRYLFHSLKFYITGFKRASCTIRV